LTENEHFEFLSSPYIFWPGILVGLGGATYAVHLTLIGIKRVVDFRLVVIERYSLGVTAEALRSKIIENRFFTGTVPVLHKISGQPHHPFFFS